MQIEWELKKKNLGFQSTLCDLLPASKIRAGGDTVTIRASVSLTSRIIKSPGRGNGDRKLARQQLQETELVGQGRYSKNKRRREVFQELRNRFRRRGENKKDN